MDIVIADASCLIALVNIGEADLLLKLYERIVVTPEVAEEVGSALPDWVELRASPNQPLIDQLAAGLEIGEATSIALALEIPDCLLIIDEKKGRRIALELGIEITGTIGVILEGLDRDLIAAPETIVKRLDRVGFRVSDSLRATISASID